MEFEEEDFKTSFANWKRGRRKATTTKGPLLFWRVPSVRFVDRQLPQERHPSAGSSTASRFLWPLVFDFVSAVDHGGGGTRRTHRRQNQASTKRKGDAETKYYSNATPALHHLNPNQTYQQKNSTS